MFQIKQILLACFFVFVECPSNAQLLHSHNDYEQKQPFNAAYNLGFDSIEADLFLKDNELFVAHDWNKISEEKTFKSLYLKPLLSKINENRGYPYPNKKSLILLLDLKKDGKELMKVLFEQLKPFKKEFRHIKIIISGDMPPPEEFQNFDKMFYFDGRDNIAYSKKSFKRVSIVSKGFADYGKYWNGDTPLSDEIFQKIKTFVEDCHAKGKQVRFWGTPNKLLAFETLHKLKVDIIGTDNLELLAGFVAQD
jgi:glycerophosphoryl diester phosphodiesterase